MKILKPGKVEMRKFVCEKCGCVFVANEYEYAALGLNDIVGCPTCYGRSAWGKGEPYEEPTPTLTDRDEIICILCKHCGADYDEAADVATVLIANGVTFRET